MRDLKPICGKCKAQLFQSSEPLNVTDSNFGEIIAKSPLPVLIDMWAEWCGPCLIMGPVIDELASELAGKVVVAKLNIEENPMTAERYNVHSIPTMLVLKSGREIGRIVGAVPKTEVLRQLNAVL